MNKKILYQPTPFDNINANNIIVRKSYDRSEKMIKFCQEYFKEYFSEKTFLDLGCSYGYFVNEFNKYCKKVVGIEIASQEINSSKIFYPDISDKIIKNDIAEELINLDQYDIVAFMNVFHSLIIKNTEKESLPVLKLIDKKTKEIMFFEMAHDKESWYEDLLPGWNDEKICNYIFENTSFKYYKKLMIDSDSIGNFKGNFGRTLFAFYRNEI